MIDLNISNSNVKQMLYLFRYFYSSPVKLNIVLNSEGWDINDSVKDSDIFSLLKKDIVNLKKQYNVYSDDPKKLSFAEDKLNDLYKLKFDGGHNFAKAFGILNRTCHILEDTKSYLVLKWFIVSFFEKFLPVVSKAYDVYKMANTNALIGIDLKNSSMGDYASEIITNKDIRYLTSQYFCMCEYLRNFYREDVPGSLSPSDMWYNYATYLKCTDKDYKQFMVLFNDINKEIDSDGLPGDIKIRVMDKIINNVLKDVDDVPENSKNIMINDSAYATIIGQLPFEDTASNRAKFLSIVNQTLSVIRENEGKNITCNISDDFKMYFITNKEEFKPIFIKRYDDLVTVINYNGVLYALYMKTDFSKDVYGVSLVNWFDTPNKIIKISPDENGKFEFRIS